MPLHSVGVFAASANDVSPTYRTLAHELGAAIAKEGWRLVYGGGRAGLMGEMATGALDAGGQVTGVIPRRLNTVERAFTDIDDLVLVDTMGERKRLLDVRSDAFAVLPGGIGTLDELTDVLTTRHLAFHTRPIVLVDPDGFWEPFTELLQHMADAHVLPPASVGLVTIVTTVSAAIDALGPTSDPTAS